MTNKKTLTACIVLAQIRHNGKDYKVGDVIELGDNDEFFLKKAGYVRQPSSDELAELTNASNANSTSHLGEHITHDDSEPNTTTLSHLDEQATDKSDKNSLLSDERVDDTSNHESTTSGYDKLTKAELIDELTTRGITHNPKAKNNELIELLVADDNKAVGE